MADTGTMPAAPQMEQTKAAMRRMWMAGDFGVIARSVARDAEEFVRKLPVASGDRVLDVACGTGNLAVPLARMGAQVTGVDIAPNLLEQARDRAAAEALKIRFDEGDAEALPYPDDSFDAVVTMFGAMFAPRPELVTREFARVCRPGGLLAMANWNPESFAGKMFRVGNKHAPPPPGVPPPVLWGDPTTVRERLEPFFEDIRTELVPIWFRMDMEPAAVVDHFRQYFGPTQMAFARLDDAGKAAFGAELTALWDEANQEPGSGRTVVANEFLSVTARRR